MRMLREYVIECSRTGHCDVCKKTYILENFVYKIRPLMTLHSNDYLMVCKKCLDEKNVFKDDKKRRTEIKQ